MTFTDTMESDKSPGNVCVCVCGNGIVLFVFYTVAMLILLPDSLGSD